MERGDRATTIVLVVGGRVELELGAFAGLRCDLAVIDALARLQLLAGRAGRSIRVVAPSAEMQGLLDLAGLAAVVATGPLPRQAGRQAEGGEQLRVEEVVDRRDPPA